jgi:hypothetical protein
MKIKQKENYLSKSHRFKLSNKILLIRQHGSCNNIRLNIAQKYQTNNI